MRPSGSPMARQAAVFSQAVRMIQRPTSGAIALSAERVDERARREHAALRMPPAQQRLGADHRFVREPDLRLEIELEFVLREGAPQFEIEAAPRLCLRAQHRQEEAIVAAAVGFGLVERKIGVGDQLVDIVAVVRRDGDAGAAAEMQDVIVDLERLRQPLQHRVDEFADRRRGSPQSGRITTNSSPPEPADRAAVAGDFRQAMADLDQQLVAGRVTERVVDVLEAVEVEQRDRVRPVQPSPASRRPSSFCSVRRLGSPVS